MNNNLKLRHVGIILLALPLISQLVFDGIMIQNLISLERAAQNEARAKSVISSLQDIRTALARNTTILMVNPSAAKVDPQKFRTTIRTKLLLLRTLTAGDKEARTVLYEYARRLNHFLGLLTCLVESRGTMNIARFINQEEFTEEISLTIKTALHCENKLFNQYRPIAEEFRPKATAARKEVLSITIMAVTINSIIVFFLALLLGRSTLNRLNILMENMRSFSRGEKELRQLSGNDELNELDREFSKMAQERQKAEQMQRSIYAMVSHDLRSPLSSVGLTLSQVLETENDLSSSLNKKLSRASSVVTLLLRLTESFLDLERSSLGKLELHLQDTSAMEIVSTAIDAVRGSAEAKDVSIISELRSKQKDAENSQAQLKPESTSTGTDTDTADGAESAEIIWCDPNRITQVVLNLISNAIKYSPKNTTITVLVIHEKGVSCRFEVRDQGRGFSEEQKQRLFRRFSQLDPRKDANIGTGLGLYICKLLVEAHKGKIGAESLPEGGSVFWIEIPQDHAE